MFELHNHIKQSVKEEFVLKIHGSDAGVGAYSRVNVTTE